jgi:hypothetical protein
MLRAYRRGIQNAEPGRYFALGDELDRCAVILRSGESLISSFRRSFVAPAIGTLQMFRFAQHDRPEKLSRHSNFLIFERSNIAQIVDRLATARSLTRFAYKIGLIARHAHSSLAAYPNRSKLPRSIGPHRNARRSRDLFCNVVLYRPSACNPRFGASSGCSDRAFSGESLSFGITASVACSETKHAASGSGYFTCSLTR